MTIQFEIQGCLKPDCTIIKVLGWINPFTLFLVTILLILLGAVITVAIYCLYKWKLEKK
jgi:hypothetical protein